MISHNLHRGFVILNVVLVSFGLWCFIGPVRRRWPSAIPLVWFWIVIELINGIGHPIWTIAEMAYTPGVATAPFLLLIALYLAVQLVRRRGHDGAGHNDAGHRESQIYARWRTKQDLTSVGAGTRCDVR